MFLWDFGSYAVLMNTLRTLISSLCVSVCSILSVWFCRGIKKSCFPFSDLQSIIQCLYSFKSVSCSVYEASLSDREVNGAMPLCSTNEDHVLLLLISDLTFKQKFHKDWWSGFQEEKGILSVFYFLLLRARPSALTASSSSATLLVFVPDICSELLCGNVKYLW